MRKQQRLVICLDGTWNNRDASTNVLHHYVLAHERQISTTTNEIVYTQRKEYHEGVGTSQLDRISGGAFGFGLEENVRGAYDWLVEHYHDTDNDADADEIFIFGFSRGAYTARSLVGLIDRCGLLRRNAPLTVSQLWENYCILGREQETRPNWAERWFGAPPKLHRQINDLVWDSWTPSGNVIPIPPLANTRVVPGQKAFDLNHSEELLIRWSRRVKIKFLGVYDTVGALGLDALAIPGLTSKLALHHNMRPSAIVENCRHALAIDEHRSNFRHTPLIAYIPHTIPTARDPQIERAHEMAHWDNRIQQRWFVGAHSNVGGGYANNELAQRPLRWLYNESIRSGLSSEALNVISNITFAQPRDSYTEFGWIWTMLLRAKRYYRAISPASELRATDPPPKGLPPGSNQSCSPDGFSLYSINEQVDDSVFDYIDACPKNAPSYAPPNLVAYAERSLQTDPHNALASRWQTIVHSATKHQWLGPSLLPHFGIVLWASFAGGGLAALHRLIRAFPLDPRYVWLLAFGASVFVIVDWVESAVNFVAARGHLAIREGRQMRALAIASQNPLGRSFGRYQAILDALYWIRALGVVLSILGFCYLFIRLFGLGWQKSVESAWDNALSAILTWWPVPASVSAAVVTMWSLQSPRNKNAFLGILLGLASTGAIVVVIGFLSCFVGHLLRPVTIYSGRIHVAPASNSEIAGLLVLLQVAGFYLVDAFFWVSEPTKRANLGSITELQNCSTSSRVESKLMQWRDALAWNPAEDRHRGEGAQALVQILETALWRDFGFIVVYFTVFTFGLWYAATFLHLRWLDSGFGFLQLWWGIPAMLAAADYVEDFCHLAYLHQFIRSKLVNPIVVLLAFSCTWIKNILFGTLSIFTLTVLVYGTMVVARPETNAGWRGSVALLISVSTLLIGLSSILLAPSYNAWKRMKIAELEGL